MLKLQQLISNTQNSWSQKTGYVLLPKVLLLFIVIFLIPTHLFSNPQTEEWDKRRIRVGFKLFPSVLAADKKIKNKQGKDKTSFLY